jgi:glycosyltransferase involved in cell wall biosynthesis
MTSKLVSAIIPVFNGEQYLTQAIHSVLAQSYAPVELIVVDDGSTDASGARAEAFPAVRVVRRPHEGLAAALNDGIRHAGGDMLAFLDADDRWLSHKLEAQVAALEIDPGLDMAFTFCRQFTSHGGEEGDAEVILGIQPGISRPGLLIRRESFLRVGDFVEDGDKHDFLDWYARSLEQKLRSLVLEEVLFERRIHARNMGRLLRVEQRARYLASLREVLTRRRHQSETEH